MNNYRDSSISDLSQWFQRFAQTECKENAPLYFHLCIDISKDEELLTIASNTRSGQPIPNIFLGAVHFLLLKNNNVELAKYYPTISKSNLNKQIPFNLFKSFCIQNEKAIVEIISTKIVQTNVINRCSYLFPIISSLVNNDNRPTTIIDIGTSAGLTLNFDYYEYWNNGQHIYGNSKVKIQTEIRESGINTILPISNKITKIGIDQNPIKPSNENDKLWLKALVWADHTERFDIMDNALSLDELNKIHFYRGDSIEDYRKIIESIPKEENLIIYATHTLYQFSQEAKINFYTMLDEIGTQRDFHFISAEATKAQLEKYTTKNTVVELTSYSHTTKSETWIAETNGHGNWIAWKNLNK